MTGVDPQPATLAGAAQFDLESRNGAVMRIQVRGPTLPAPPAGYPVAWFTDGAATFATAANQMWIREGMELEPALIVGVGYPESDRAVQHVRRTFDLTPPTPPEASAFSGLATGGGEAFQAFIMDDVTPRLAELFPIDRRRQLLYGHSLGGLFTLGCFARSPGAFAWYVASSPSIWWNDDWILGPIERALSGGAAGSAAEMLLCVGGLEETPATAFPGATPEAIAAHAALIGRARMIANAKALHERLAAAGLKSEFVTFAEEGHASVMPASIARALDFAFGYEKRKPRVG